MPETSNSPSYPYPPIGSLKALARMLQVESADALCVIVKESESLYRVAKEKRKDDGSLRICYDAMPPLKSIHARIQCLILKKVRYPYYLMGGICDKEKPRDHVRNAQIHRGARVVITEDITEFFPSTSTAVVFDVWRNFFKFPFAVAQTLTALTTKDGVLPQGAKTSGYIANLAFWRTEPRLVTALSAEGFSYSRYVDDIAVSSKTDRTGEALGEVVASIAGMLKARGYRLKRRKHRIGRAGKVRVITGLNVAETVTLKHKKRAALRAQVHQCEILMQNQPDSAELRSLLQKTPGMIGQLKRLHPRESEQLRLRFRTLQGRG